MKDKLILKLNKGSIKALEQIIRQYDDYVFFVIRNHSGDVLSKEDIEELASDTFVALWNNRRSVDAAKPLMPYLAVVAKNKTVDKLRSLHITVNIEDTDLCDDDFDQRFENAEAVREILVAAEKLPAKQREIFIRFYFYGETLKAIAEAMGITYPDSRTSLHRARNAVKEYLSERGYFNE